jgi:hypothetical protein
MPTAARAHRRGDAVVFAPVGAQGVSSIRPHGLPVYPAFRCEKLGDLANRPSRADDAPATMAVRRAARQRRAASSNAAAAFAKAEAGPCGPKVKPLE